MKNQYRYPLEQIKDKVFECIDNIAETEAKLALIWEFKVNPFYKSLGEDDMEEDDVNPLKGCLTHKEKILFEVSSRMLLKQTNVKVKKMLDLILRHAENEQTLEANNLNGKAEEEKKIESQLPLFFDQDINNNNPQNSPNRKLIQGIEEPQEESELLRHFSLINESMILEDDEQQFEELNLTSEELRQSQNNHEIEHKQSQGMIAKMANSTLAYKIKSTSENMSEVFDRHFLSEDQYISKKNW